MTSKTPSSAAAGWGSLLAYFAFTYAISWTAFVLAPPGTPGFLLGVFAPSLVALAFTARAEGRRGIDRLVRQLAVWPARAGWFMFALGYMAAVKLAAAALVRIVLGEWPTFGNTPFYLMAAAIVVSTPVQAGEELGWRGYALPRLARRLGPGVASIVIGAIWAGWHLPIFFVPASDTYQQSFPVYLISVVALSVAMAWLYWASGGSLLLTMTMHAAINNTKDIVPSAAAAGATPFHLSASPVAWLTAALLWIPAIWFLLRMRRVFERVVERDSARAAVT